jgi:hypothetical protein
VTRWDEEQSPSCGSALSSSARYSGTRPHASRNSSKESSPAVSHDILDVRLLNRTRLALAYGTQNAADGKKKLAK